MDDKQEPIIQTVEAVKEIVVDATAKKDTNKQTNV